MSKKLNNALDKIVVSDELKAKIMKNAANAGKKPEKKITPFPIRKISAIAASFAILLCVISAFQLLKPEDVTAPAPKTPQISVPSTKQSTEPKGNDVPTVSVPKTDREPDSLPGKNTDAVTPPANNIETTVPPAESNPPTENDLPALSQNPFGNDDELEQGAAGGGVQGGYYTEGFSSKEELSERAGFSVLSPAFLPDGYAADAYTLICGELAQVTYAKENEQITYRMQKGNENISGDYNVYDITETRTINGASVFMQGAGDGYHIAAWTDKGYSCSITCTEGIERDDLVKIIESIQ